jgi:hypothetical protein
MENQIVSYTKDVVQMGFSVWVAIYLLTVFRKTIDELKENIKENTRITQEMKKILERLSVDEK